MWLRWYQICIWSFFSFFTYYYVGSGTVLSCWLWYCPAGPGIAPYWYPAFPVSALSNYFFMIIVIHLASQYFDKPHLKFQSDRYGQFDTCPLKVKLYFNISSYQILWFSRWNGSISWSVLIPQGVMMRSGNSILCLCLFEFYYRNCFYDSRLLNHRRKNKNCVCKKIILKLNYITIIQFSIIFDVWSYLSNSNSCS